MAGPPTVAACLHEMEKLKWSLQRHRQNLQRFDVENTDLQPWKAQLEMQRLNAISAHFDRERKLLVSMVEVAHKLELPQEVERLEALDRKRERNKQSSRRATREEDSVGN